MKRNIIIGGGPAGLSAAYELSKQGHAAVVFEQGSKLGGLARTETYRNYHYDLGGHRFFSKSKEINQLWTHLLGDDLLTRSRLSRIYYRETFFNYPLKPLNAFLGLGPFETARILGSYFRQQLFPYPEESSFEAWVSNRFGKRLFEIFFKSYTEKVWGMSCKEIGADWAAQRIKGLSLRSAIFNALFGTLSGNRDRAKQVKTLLDEFKYPVYGPGMVWDRMAEEILSNGGRIQKQSKVTALEIKRGKVVDCTINGHEKKAADHYISSMPLAHLLRTINDPDIRTVANELKYRAFLTVVLIIDQEKIFPDQWVYIHAPEVALGRVQNFKNWSPRMVPDPHRTCLGLEYFCDVGDALWNTADDELIARGKAELAAVGLLKDTSKVLDGKVVRVSDAYPVYDHSSRAVLGVIKKYLAGIENLQVIGRAGMHRYNNMDHSMLTGLLAARNIINPQKTHDLWRVNADEEYHEG